MISSISNHVVFDIQAQTGGGGRAQQEGKVGYQQGQEVLGPLITLARVEDPVLAHALGCHLRGQQSVICSSTRKEPRFLVVMHPEQRLHFSVAVTTVHLHESDCRTRISAIQLKVMPQRVVTDLFCAVLQSQCRTL